MMCAACVGAMKAVLSLMGSNVNFSWIKFGSDWIAKLYAEARLVNTTGSC